MADGLSLEEWQIAYRADKEKVRRQIQTLLTLYQRTGEEDKLKVVKSIWLELVSMDQG